MKLSARERQRVQRWVIALVVLACMLYVYVHLLIQPLVRMHMRDSNELAMLEQKIEGAESDLRASGTMTKEYVRLSAELTVATNRDVLRPTIGALLATCQNLLDPLAAAYGLTTDVYIEKGRQDIPGVKKGGNILFERYAMEVSMQGGYDRLRTFLAALERTNSYVCVTDISIQGRAEDPLRHKIMVRLEWPVFGERVTAADARTAPGAPGDRVPEGSP